MSDVRQKHRLMPPPIRGGGITSCRRAAATICHRHSPPPVGAEAPCAAEQTAT